MIQRPVPVDVVRSFVAFMLSAWLTILVCAFTSGCAVRWEDQNGPADPERFSLEPAWPTGQPCNGGASGTALPTERDAPKAYEVAPPVAR